jgi:signal transduction histidine kinase
MEAVSGTSIEQYIVDRFPAGIVVFRVDGSVHTMNKSAQTIIRGLCNPELISSWKDFLLFFNLPTIRMEAELSRNEMVIGDHTYVLYPTMVPTNSGAVRIVYIADITEEKRLVQDIQIKTSSILMGIRTRVTGIQNALGLMLDYKLPPEESAGLVKDSRYEIWLLSRYADNLKDLSLCNADALSDALSIQPLLLFRIVKEAIDNTAIFRAYHESATPIRNSVPRDLSVCCDRTRMVKVIESVLLNALIYAGHNNEIDIGAAIDGHWAILTIKDRGIGIPVEDQQHLFEYRFRGRNKEKVKYNGMGIELYLAKLNVEYQEGTISFSSEEGAGACFEIALKRNCSPADSKTSEL